MKNQISLLFLFILFACSTVSTYAAGLENQTIKIKSNERFQFANGGGIQFKFKPLTDQARALEITQSASALGVAYLGQIQLKENITALSALRSIADQIGESLNISFGVIADSNTSEALKSNELLLLYHPTVTITLALARPSEESNFEIICTYALKDTKKEKAAAEQAATQEQKPTPISEEANPEISEPEEVVSE